MTQSLQTVNKLVKCTWADHVFVLQQKKKKTLWKWLATHNLLLSVIPPAGSHRGPLYSVRGLLHHHDVENDVWSSDNSSDKDKHWLVIARAQN